MSAWDAKGKVRRASEAADIMEGHEPNGLKIQIKSRSSCGERGNVWRLFSKSRLWNLRVLLWSSSK